MKTLLATDGSSYATTGLMAASQLLTRAANKFDVVCVIRDYSPPSHLSRRSLGIRKLAMCRTGGGMVTIMHSAT